MGPGRSRPAGQYVGGFCPNCGRALVWQRPTTDTLVRCPHREVTGVVEQAGRLVPDYAFQMYVTTDGTRCWIERYRPDVEAFGLKGRTLGPEKRDTASLRGGVQTTGSQCLIGSQHASTYR